MFTDYTAITWVVVAPLPNRGWFWTGLLRTTYPSILDHKNIKCPHTGFPNEQIHYCTTTGSLTTYFILWDGINLRFSSCDDSKGLDPFQYLRVLVFPPPLSYVDIFDLWHMNRPGSNIPALFETYLLLCFFHGCTPDTCTTCLTMRPQGFRRRGGRPALWTMAIGRPGVFPLRKSAQNGRF